MVNAVKTFEADGVAPGETGTGIGSVVGAPANIRYEKRLITPTEASAMLERAHDPRPNANATRIYANAMSAGAWILNGQTIVLDPFDRVLDGVQRLNACVAAGTPFETFVARNVPADTLHTLDQHRRRYFSGVLESRNYRNASALQRLMSRQIKIENGNVLQNRLSISWVRYDRVFASNPELIAATDLVEDLDLISTIPTSALDSLAFMALRSTDTAAQAIRPFLQGLSDVEPTTLRNAANIVAYQIETARAVGTPYEVTHALALLILGFNDFVRGGPPAKSYKWEPIYGKLTGREKRADLSERQINAILRARAPFNNGFPSLDGYRGLREGRFEDEADAGEFSGEIRQELLRGISRTSPDVTIATMRITPAVAHRMLKFNTRNRKIQKSHIDAIARDIENDRWMVNAQAISFAGNPNNPDAATDTELLNGQHRLQAIIAANQAIDVPVAVNIAREAFSTFDIHAKKGPRSTISNGYSRILQAAARLQWKEDMGMPLIGRGSPTSGEILETLERHPGIKDALTASRRKPLLVYASSGVLAYFLYRITKDDPVLAVQYVDELSGDGSGLGKGNPVLRIRMEAHDKRHTTRKNMIDLLLSNWDKYRRWHNGEADSLGTEDGHQGQLI